MKKRKRPGRRKRAAIAARSRKGRTRRDHVWPFRISLPAMVVAVLNAAGVPSSLANVGACNAPHRVMASMSHQRRGIR